MNDSENLQWHVIRAIDVRRLIEMMAFSLVQAAEQMLWDTFRRLHPGGLTVESGGPRGGDSLVYLARSRTIVQAHDGEGWDIPTVVILARKCDDETAARDREIADAVQLEHMQSANGLSVRAALRIFSGPWVTPTWWGRTWPLLKPFKRYQGWPHWESERDWERAVAAPRNSRGSRGPSSGELYRRSREIELETYGPGGIEKFNETHPPLELMWTDRYPIDLGEEPPPYELTPEEEKIRSEIDNRIRAKSERLSPDTQTSPPERHSDIRQLSPLNDRGAA